jgi:hypothetical protein
MGFLGMRGTGDWVTDGRPKSWREGILLLYPNGTAPLTAILGKMKGEALTDPEFNWWTKTLATQRMAVTGVYTDAILSTAYTSGGVAGTILYLKGAEASVAQFRVGHQVLLRDASDFTVDVVGKVTDRTLNGSSSSIAVKLLEADNNSSYGQDLSDCDTAIIVGSINEEGAPMPTGVSFDPTKMYNYTQIFRSPLSLSRTARKTKLRTGDAYKEMKREVLEYHSIEMERAFIFGVKTENTGTGGKPERTTDGILTMIRANASGNVSDFTLNATYHGKDWLDSGGGEKWLNYYLELMFRYGRGEKLALCGTGALLGINALAQAGSHFTITTTTKAYGISVSEWVTPFGTIYLKTHPLFNVEDTLRYSMLVIEPENIKYRYIDDTNFYGEGDAKQAAPGTNSARVDGTNEEFLTEAGLEYHHPSTGGFLNGVGQDHDS